MADFSGRKVKYGIGKETVRGTAVTPTYWVRWETADFEDTGKQILNQSSIGVLNKYSGAEMVDLQATGQLAGKVTDQTIGTILLGLFGTVSDALHSAETTVYDHTFSESQSNTSQSLTISRVDPNVQEQFALAMVNSFELDVKAGDYVRHITQFMSKPSATTTGLSPAFIAENEFIAKHVTVKMANNTSGLAGATAINASSAKLTITKTVNPYFQVGSSAPGEMFADATEIKGEIVLRYSDSTYKTLTYANTPQAVQIDIVNSGVTIGNSAHPEINITMPLCYLDTWKVNQAQDNIVEQTIDFEAVYSLADSKAISCVLTNTVTSY